MGPPTFHSAPLGWVLSLNYRAKSHSSGASGGHGASRKQRKEALRGSIPQALGPQAVLQEIHLPGPKQQGRVNDTSGGLRVRNLV